MTYIINIKTKIIVDILIKPFIITTMAMLISFYHVNKLIIVYINLLFYMKMEIISTFTNKILAKNEQ